MLVDKETLVLKERLVEINLCLWTLWAATSVAAFKLAKLFKLSNRLICIHGSGKAVNQRSTGATNAKHKNYAFD